MGDYESASPPVPEIETSTEQSDAALPPSKPKSAFLTRKRLLYVSLLVIGVLAIVLVTILVQKPDNPVEYARSIGYGGVFLMGLIGSASPVWPLPGSWAAGLGAAFGLNPFLVGLAAGFGEPIGELSGYTAGYGGQIAVNKWQRYSQIENWMRRHGGITIFVVSAIPNFFIKLATIAAGALRYPLWRFFIFCWGGKTIKSWGFAFVGAAFSEWLIRLFEDTL